MKINLRVIPNAKVEQVREDIDGNLKVWLKAKPVEGKANEHLIKILSKRYKVPKSSIQIVSGLKSRNKIVEINS